MLLDSVATNVSSPAANPNFRPWNVNQVAPPFQAQVQADIALEQQRVADGLPLRGMHERVDGLAAPYGHTSYSAIGGTWSSQDIFGVEHDGRLRMNTSIKKTGESSYKTAERARRNQIATPYLPAMQAARPRPAHELGQCAEQGNLLDTVNYAMEANPPNNNRQPFVFAHSRTWDQRKKELKPMCAHCGTLATEACERHHGLIIVDHHDIKGKPQIYASSTTVRPYLLLPFHAVLLTLHLIDECLRARACLTLRTIPARPALYVSPGT